MQLPTFSELNAGYLVLDDDELTLCCGAGVETRSGLTWTTHRCEDCGELVETD